MIRKNLLAALFAGLLALGAVACEVEDDAGDPLEEDPAEQDDGMEEDPLEEEEDDGTEG